MRITNTRKGIIVRGRHNDLLRFAEGLYRDACPEYRLLVAIFGYEYTDNTGGPIAWANRHQLSVKADWRRVAS